MKVLIFQNAPAPYRHLLFKKLSEKFDLTVVYGTQATKDRFWDVSGSEYPHAFMSGTTLKIKNKTFTYAKGLSKYLKKHTFDATIINDDLRCVLSNITLIRKTRQRRKPIILWCGSIDTPYRRNVMLRGLLGAFHKVYMKYLVKQSSAYLAYGPKTVDYFSAQFPIPRERFIWGTQAAEGEITASLRVKNTVSDIVHFLYMGYLEKRKGVRDLIEALNSLTRKDYTLRIAGKGPEETSLKRLVENNPRIKFAGYVEGEDKKRCYLDADVLVSPTYHDPWANTINEACLYGLPIITTTAEGSESFLAINRHNSVIVPPGHIEKLKAALEFFMDHKESIADMGKKSEALASKFNLDWAADNFLKIISIAQGT